jgi:hypothetical protein
LGTCWLGIDAIIRGHNYYRATLYQKTALEALLGIAAPVDIPPGRRVPLGAGTTTRMRRGHSLLAECDAWTADAPLKRGSITWNVTVALLVLAAIDAIGAVLTWYQ